LYPLLAPSFEFSLIYALPPGFTAAYFCRGRDGLPENIFWIERLGLGNGRDGNSHAGDSNGQLRALPRRRVRRKPLKPFFIHTREVRFLKKNDSRTHDSFEGSACGFEDGRHILQALSGLLLDRIPDNLSGYRIVRSRA
jgi:hypothetical protein